MLNANGVNPNEFVEYLGRPLVRKEEEILYGDLSEKYYIYMLIMSEKETDNGAMPDKIMVQLLDSEKHSPLKQKVVMGLKQAFDFANAWLDTNQ